MNSSKTKWVRPTIAVIFAVGVTVGFFMKLLTSEAYLPIAAVAITWWFKSRDEENSINNGALK